MTTGRVLKVDARPFVFSKRFAHHLRSRRIGSLACDVIASPAKACAHVSISIARHPRPRSDGPCSLGGLQGRERCEGHHLQVHGIKAVTDGQLRSVLATTPSSKLPWGDKHYFSREQFNADLKRIEAFYKDRGFRTHACPLMMSSPTKIRRLSRSPSLFRKGIRSSLSESSSKGSSPSPSSIGIRSNQTFP